MMGLRIHEAPLFYIHKGFVGFLSFYTIGYLEGIFFINSAFNILLRY